MAPVIARTTWGFFRMMRLCGDWRVVAVAAVVATVGSTLVVGVANAEPATLPAAESTFAVTMGSNESLGHAIVELVAEMPEQAAVVRPVLDRMAAQLRNGPVPVGDQGATFTLSQLDLTNRWLAMEAKSAGTGFAAAERVERFSVAQPTEQTLAATTRWQGTQGLNHIVCSPRTCSVVAWLSHTHEFNLGWNTFRVISRLVGSPGWTGVSMRSQCRFLSSGSGCSLYALATINGGGWIDELFNYSLRPGGARYQQTFRGAYNGIPGSTSGYSPVITCDSSVQLCRFS